MPGIAKKNTIMVTRYFSKYEPTNPRLPVASCPTRIPSGPHIVATTTIIKKITIDIIAQNSAFLSRSVLTFFW